MANTPSSTDRISRTFLLTFNGQIGERAWQLRRAKSFLIHSHRHRLLAQLSPPLAPPPLPGVYKRLREALIDQQFSSLAPFLPSLPVSMVTCRPSRLFSQSSSGISLPFAFSFFLLRLLRRINHFESSLSSRTSYPHTSSGIINISLPLSPNVLVQADLLPSPPIYPV